MTQQLTQTTPCIRCGKARILAKSWTEKIDGHTTSYTQTVCPDPECQKLVEKELQKREEKMAALHARSLEKRKSIVINNRANRRK